MEEYCNCWFVWIIGGYIIYKLLDWLIRLPYLGGHNDRYFFVTGCDTGFGHEIAKRLDKKGANVYCGCLTEKGEDGLRKQCSKRLKTVHLDVADPASIQTAYDFVRKDLPAGKGLWGLLNNAGISGKVGPTPWITISDYEETISVNLYGVIETTRVFLPLIKKEKGRVLSTASVFGRTSLAGGIPYTISKYGVEAFGDGLRRELYDYGCLSILIEPGFHKTNIVSDENIFRWIEASWHKLPEHVKEEYGEEYLVDSKDFLTNKFVAKVASERISDVVDAYEHGLMGRFPRARYVVGKDAKFFWLPIQWMPEWLGDALLRLGALGRPMPASLKK